MAHREVGFLTGFDERAEDFHENMLSVCVGSRLGKITRKA